MYTKLLKVIGDSGLWANGGKETHGFQLSPNVFQISEMQKRDLEELGLALYDSLLGLSHMATIVFDPLLNYSGVWRRIRQVFSTGVPKSYLGLQGMNIRHIPKLLKVDLMIDQDGHFRIAEIDGHNKHGVGYSTLCRRFAQAIEPNGKFLPGTAKRLADEVKSQGYNQLKIFYGDRERFYLPEFLIAKSELELNGIECVLISEARANDQELTTGLLLDLPFLHTRPHLYDAILPAYKNGDVRFIIPPKPFLGSKGVLALLRNDGVDEDLESVLRTFIGRKSLQVIRRYVPETRLVGSLGAGQSEVERMCQGRRYVLKRSISSGMKGTIFSDDPSFTVALEQAARSKLDWIIQEEVQNQPQTFSCFVDKGMRQVTGSWFMRVIVQYVNRGLADVVITARQDKSVHGAPDCIQLGTVIK